MGHEHWLRAPQVCVRGHRRVPGQLRLGHEGFDYGDDRSLQLWNLPTQVQPEVDRHLLVARSAGVQSFAGLADALNEFPLHKRMHILIVGSVEHGGVGVDGDTHSVETGNDGGGVGGGEYTRTTEGLGPGATAGDVLIDQAFVDGQRLAEIKDLRVGGVVEPAAPQICHDYCPSRFASPMKHVNRILPSAPSSAASAWWSSTEAGASSSVRGRAPSMAG